MNKARFLAVFVLIAIAAAAAAAFLLRHPAKHALKAATLLPEDSIAFLYLPDVGGSGDRWEKTALHKIAVEPEVKAFMDSTRSKLPYSSAIDRKLAEIRRVKLGETFVAVTAITDSAASVVAGFSFAGKKENAQALLADLNDFIRRSAPAGAADLVKYKENAIEVFRDGNRTVASVFHDDWYLVASDLGLLESTLDRFAGEDRGPALASSPVFHRCLSHLPESFECLMFVQPGTLIDRIAGLFGTAGLGPQKSQLEELRKVKAFAAITRFEGENIRDAAFTFIPGLAEGRTLKRRSLRFTSSSTPLYYASKIVLPEHAIDLPDPSLDRFGILRTLESMKASLARQGLGLGDFAKAFGPEGSMILDWPPAAPQPALLLTVDMRDRRVAERLITGLLQSLIPRDALARQEQNDVTYYATPEIGFGLAPALAISDDFLLAGGSVDGLKKAFSTSQNALAANPDFKAATETLPTPTAAFGYVDAKALFERVYRIARPLLVMGASLAPDAQHYVDMSKLPPAEAISRHLTPISLSQGDVADGTLVESVGPVTFNQVVAATLIGGAAVAIPLLGQQLPQGLSGLTSPPSAPPSAAQPPTPTAESRPPEPASAPPASESSPIGF